MGRNTFGRRYGLWAVLSGILTIVVHGCGGVPGGRDTLPSTITDDPGNGNDNGSTIIDPAGDDMSDLRIEAVEDPDIPGKWVFQVKSTRRPVADTGLGFEWDFGAGDTAFGPDQTYVFTEAGEHLITVTARDRDGQVVLILTLRVVVAEPNLPPEALAGADLSVLEGDEVTLSAQASSDPEGGDLTYSWLQVGSSSPVTLSEPAGAATSFVAPDVDRDTVLQFEVSVSDGAHTSKDVVLVEVLNIVGGAGSSLTAVAGPDQQVTSGTVVTLDGSLSGGGESTVLAFEWTQTSGPVVAIQTANQAVASFLAPQVAVPTNLVFRLTVSEVESLAFDDVLVIVAPAATGGGGGGGGGEEVVDLCPDDPAKTEPGSCGCGIPDDDSDGDGTPDCDDGCPVDLAKIDPGLCGCGVSDADSDADGIPDCNDGCAGAADVDTDGDGLLDCDDGCPNDPNKTNAGFCGCGVSDVDSDGDLVRDCVDGCPSNPLKIQPGQCGCAVPDTDTDGDGTANCNDLCPSDPGKIAPGICGCGVSDADSDGDSTLNCLDNCPLDPQKIIPGVCGCGVADIDSDGDGYPNCIDVCPGHDDDIDANANGTPDGCEPPALCVSTTALNLGTTTSSASFQVRNCGGSTINYTVTDNRSWLSVSPASGSSTGENDGITVTVNRAGLAGGNYSGDVTVTPSVGSAIVVAISMTVSGAGGTPPNASLVASRTSGVSPLGVFFDASGTTSPATSRPFHELHYTWDFDDPTAEFTNARRCTGTAMPCSTSADCASGQTCQPVSTATATGPMAAHVFELPRTCSGSGASCDDDGDCPSGQTCDEIAGKNYTVTLTVRDATGASTTVPQVITVTRFSGTTYYAASGVNANGQSTGSPGNDTNSGLSPSNAFKTWDKAISMLFLSNGPRRALFRRGDAFTAPQAFAGSRGINRIGPFVIGTYGSGADPVIQSTHASTTLEIKSTSRDIRIVDLVFQGPPPGNPAGTALSTGSDCLILRCELREYLNGMMSAIGSISGTIIADSIIAVQDDYGVYLSAGGTNSPPYHIGLIGCRFDRVFHEHLVRTYITRSAISQNTFLNGVGRGTHLKLCAAGETSQLKTEYVLISENAWVTPTDSPGLCAIGPENSSSRQLVENVIVERNVFDLRSSNGGQDAIHSWGANDVTVRNNVFLDTRAWVWFHSPVVNFSTWNDWHIYNNTGYRDINADTMLIRAANTGNVANGMVVRNNVAAVTRATAAIVKAIDAPHTPLAELQASNNVWYFPTRTGSQLFSAGGANYTFVSWQAAGKDANSLTVDPLLTAAPLNVNLQLSSPAVNAGMALAAVQEDIVHRGRPQGAAVDMGAFERN